MKKRKAAFISVLAVVLTAVFPAVFLYCNNAEEAAFKEILPAIAISAALALASYLLCRLILHKAYTASVVATTFVLLLTNFAYLEKGIKIFFDLEYWQTVPILIVIQMHVAWFVSRRLSDEAVETVSKTIGLVFSLLIAFNVIMAAPGMISRASLQRELKENTSKNETLTADASAKPNIYMILFDEYAGFRQMQEYYHYDNAVLKDFLEENHFNISYTSQNEGIQTRVVLGDVVSLDYVITSDSDSHLSEITAALNSGVLFDFLREHGYYVQGVQDEPVFDLPSPIENNTETKGKTMSGESLTDLCLEQSILYPLYRVNASERLEEILKVADYMSDADHVKNESTFTWVYFNFPHQPFVVDENGVDISTAYSTDWVNKKWYLGQYKYATKLMIKICQNIIDHDPESIILLWSDHGARAGLRRDGVNWFYVPFEVITNPLNAVYYKGEELDIEGLSSLNTLRTVLNRAFGTDFEILPVPEWSVYRHTKRYLDEKEVEAWKEK